MFRLQQQSGRRAAARRTSHSGYQPAGRPRLLELASRGPYAETWKAVDPGSGQTVALRQARFDCVNPAAARLLLANEAEVLALLRGHHAAALLEERLGDSPPALVQEWLRGETLARRLATRGHLPPRDALWVARQCAQGLRVLQQAGFLHGALVPENVFIESTGKVRLINLGFARVDVTPADRQLEASGRPAEIWPEPGSDQPIRQLGALLCLMLGGCLPGGRGARQAGDAANPWKQPLRSLPKEVARDVEHLMLRLAANQPLRRAVRLDELIGQLVGLELRAACES